MCWTPLGISLVFNPKRVSTTKAHDKNMQDYGTNPIVIDLIDQLRKNKVIPFVGAGVSANAGLPGWGDLVDRVSDALNVDRNVIREKRDLLVAIEYLMIQGQDIIPSIL